VLIPIVALFFCGQYQSANVLGLYRTLSEVSSGNAIYWVDLTVIAIALDSFLARVTGKSKNLLGSYQQPLHTGSAYLVHLPATQYGPDFPCRQAVAAVNRLSRSYMVLHPVRDSAVDCEEDAELPTEIEAVVLFRNVVFIPGLLDFAVVKGPV
jgi:hypothetical protein